MDVSDARRLKVLEDENALLKNLLADQMLDNANLKDVAAKNADAACEAEGGGSCLRGAWVSQCRACQALNIDRSTVRYASTRPEDAASREAMKTVAAERRRFGYRRIHVTLDRQGIVMNQKKLRRLYLEEKLQARRRKGASGLWAHAGPCSCPIVPTPGEPRLRLRRPHRRPSLPGAGRGRRL